jgi:AraC-like DNA-binding protein
MNRARALRHVTAEQPEVVVVACGLSRSQRGYVADGLRVRAQCRFIDSFDELSGALRTLPRCDAVVIAPQDQLGRDARPAVEALAREWPGTAIVVFCPPRVEGSLPRTLLLAGAHDFAFEGMYDTAGSIALKVENALRECAAESVFNRLQPLIPGQLHTMVQQVLARANRLTSVDDVAAALGVHRKTLVNWCAKSGFLQPAEVIMWCRLAMVGHQLERTGSTVEAIGLKLGFASHTALRNLIKRHTGRIATEIRKEGGLSGVLAALQRRLESRKLARLPIA